MATDAIVERSAISMLVTKAEMSAGSRMTPITRGSWPGAPCSAMYQSNVNPSQVMFRTCLLNEKTTSTTMGR